MIEKPGKKIILIHTLVAIAVAIILYFFVSRVFLKAFLFTSLLFNLYLRLLSLNFSFLDPAKASSNASIAIFSSLRMIIIAVILAVFIVKFKFKLLAMAIAFVLYKVVLLGSGFLTNK